MIHSIYLRNILWTCREDCGKDGKRTEERRKFRDVATQWFAGAFPRGHLRVLQLHLR